MGSSAAPMKRGLTHAEAADYCGTTVANFDQQVAAKRLPAALSLVGRKKVWDRVALDRALDAMSGVSAELTTEQRKREAVKRILADAGKNAVRHKAG